MAAGDEDRDEPISAEGREVVLVGFLCLRHSGPHKIMVRRRGLVPSRGPLRAEASDDGRIDEGGVVFRGENFSPYFRRLQRMSDNI